MAPAGKDDEVSGEGNNLAFADRGYDSRLGRWNKLDRKQGKYPGWSPYHFCYNSPIITIDPDGKENIVVAGGQHDNSANNKLMFAHQALRQLRQYKVNEADETRSLVLFTEGYTPKQIQKIEKAAEKLGAIVIKVNSSAEVVNYINSKATDNSNLSGSRIYDPATNVDLFSHGIVGSVEFGYEQPNAAQAKFDANSAANLDPGAFSHDAVLTSYACRTGLGNSNISSFAFPGEDDKTETSLAQTIADKAKITVRAYLKRSDYSSTLSSTQDRFMMKMYDKTGMGAKRAETIKWYNGWQNRLQNRENVDGATFDPEGAVHGVDGGDTPVGVSGEMKTYTPKE